MFFSRRLSSQVAGSGGGAGGVGPAKNELYLQELCGNTEHLQVQPMYLVLQGCVCSLVSLCPSQLISHLPGAKIPEAASAQHSRAGCLVTHKNLGISKPKGGCCLPVWISLISRSAHGLLQQQGISHGSSSWITTFIFNYHRIFHF